MSLSERGDLSGVSGKTQKKMLLNVQNLKELQRIDDESKLSYFQVLSKFYNDDLYTDFDKAVLLMKPNDCAIVQKYAKMETFQIERHPRLENFTINTLYSDHPLREFHRRSIMKLKDSAADSQGLRNAREQIDKIESLPLIVFIHGLGGQLSQFEPILQEFRNCADIFGIDLPGFGNSKPGLNKSLFGRLSSYSDEDIAHLEDTLSRMSWEDFQTDSIADIVCQILLSKFPKRKFIIISHSMGTHISIKLINKLPANTVEGLCMLSPPKLSPSANRRVQMPATVKAFMSLCNYYPRLFDLYRLFDRSGGLHSKSVDAYIYPEEHDLLKRLTQLRWNLDTDSRMFLRYLKGFTPATTEELLSAASKIHNSSDLDIPKILICCGDRDRMTPLSSSQTIFAALKEASFGVKLDVVKDANHSLFLDRPHMLSGMIYQFVVGLHLNIDCTWVLQVRAIISGDKWSLKNMEKWNNSVTLSKPLINSISPEKPISPLLGMKTLRENDKTHNPRTFEHEHAEIYAIVDIGSDTPSYDPEDFNRIQYVKFKTESKVTPDDVTIAKFLEIIDKLVTKKKPDQFIVVHCHYGQNRTGFLISCYLVERLGWTVKESLDAFEDSKEPGIKHQHFKNALYLRYGE
ncbi:DEKNAAC104999 [Brettanomyces naardenensis]|uniref:DEKNAAC104999 n=1 Tax=Brettanomyces naardenensis TaxID=13370 RepID=A0A448YSE3_BRENA|nr:DEKNAAC104999 [Brettanomyces naardenensis]